MTAFSQRSCLLKLNPLAQIGKNLSGNKKSLEGPKKSSRRHPKVPPEGLQRPICPPPGPPENASPSRKSPISEKVDYSRELLPKKLKGYPHCVLWPQPPVRPSRGVLAREVSLLRPPHAGHPEGSADSKGLRPTAADPRKHPGTRNARGREKIDRDGLRVIEISTD